MLQIRIKVPHYIP